MASRSYAEYDLDETLTEIGSLGYPAVKIYWNEDQSCWNVHAEGFAVTTGGDSVIEAVVKLWRYMLPPAELKGN